MEALPSRKQDLLAGIVQEYIITARPVSSKLLVDKLGLNLSPATIRNEMKDLEDKGLITHPYTSAGRIPTVVGYQYYIEHFLDRLSPLAQPYQTRLDEMALGGEDNERPIKQLAKAVAAISNDAVLVSFSSQSFYYTGITNLFHKPEFRDLAEVTVLSELIDHLDEVMANLQKQNFSDIGFLLGEANPVSQYCAAVVTHYGVRPKITGVMAILGPLRMDYQLNHQILRHVHSLFNTITVQTV